MIYCMIVIVFVLGPIFFAGNQFDDAVLVGVLDCAHNEVVGMLPKDSFLIVDRDLLIKELMVFCNWVQVCHNHHCFRHVLQTEAGLHLLQEKRLSLFTGSKVCSTLFVIPQT